MKHRWLIIGLVTFTCTLRAQAPDSAYRKQKVSKTDIEAVYAHYIQDGNNSAVTGGTGTEKLTVYSPSVKLSRKIKSYHTVSAHAGVDVISSASTDNIDFVVSSASIMDGRTYTNLSYKKDSKKRDLAITAGTGFSIESDYFSLPLNIAAEYTEPKKARSYQAVFQAYFDDLRWGRLNENYHRPVKLIYPAELRYKQWYNHEKRQSYNLKLGFTQVINKRMIAGIFPELSYQQGLLATPFHRVYFSDGSLRVENLPDNRLKIPLGLKLNYFAGKRYIIKSQYGYYRDNFGIRANSIEIETAIRKNPRWTISPFIRLYKQSGSLYFKPYMMHAPEENFYTSDYDLSAFSTVKTGVALRYAPYKYLNKKLLFEDISLRYAYFHRSNGLYAHILSLVIHMSSTKT